MTPAPIWILFAAPVLAAATELVEAVVPDADGDVVLAETDPVVLAADGLAVEEGGMDVEAIDSDNDSEETRTQISSVIVVTPVEGQPKPYYCKVEER